MLRWGLSLFSQATRDRTKENGSSCTRGGSLWILSLCGFVGMVVFSLRLNLVILEVLYNFYDSEIPLFKKGGCFPPGTS